MITEYAVEVRNKYHSFVEQLDVFKTYEEAKDFAGNGGFEIDNDCEYTVIIEIEYDDNGNEIGCRQI